jgi:hypothetical protein
MAVIMNRGRFGKARETVLVSLAKKERRLYYCIEEGLARQERWLIKNKREELLRSACILHTITDVGFLYKETRRLQSNFLSRHYYSQFNSTKDDALLSPGNIRPGSLLFSNTQDPRSEKTKNAWLLKNI